MSKQNFNNTSHTQYESLCDLKLLGLWSQCGRDWSSTIQEEIQSTINQTAEEEESKPTNKVVLF